MNNPGSIVAVIPARGGSRRIPRKNLVPLLGKPLLAYTVEAALESQVAEWVIVSTNSTEIADVARRYGAEVVERPEEISHDTASTESALLHVVGVLRASGWDPEFVLTLPPTSPLRSAASIRSFVAAFRERMDLFDAMISVTEDFGDYWIRVGPETYERLFKDAPRRRQDRTPIYDENSAMYITRTSSLVRTGSVLGSSVTAFVLDPVEAIDINEPADLEWAELHLRRRGRTDE